MKISFKNKMALLIVCCCTTVAALLSGMALYQQSQASGVSLKEMRKTLYEDYDKASRNQVETAISLLQNTFSRSQKGELTLEEAKKLGADLVRELKYDKEGYFWVDTVEGVNVVLLGKPTEGKSRIDLVDKKGKQLVREIIEKGKQPGGGYTDYWFPKAGSDVPSPKRGYSLEFKPFGWVVGTGNYVDDMEAIIAKAEADQNAKLKRSMLIFLGLTAVSVVTAIVISFIFSKRLISQLGGEPDEIASMATRIADGDLSVAAGRSQGGETGVYAAMLSMSNRLKGIIGDITSLSRNVAAESDQLRSRISEMAAGANDTAGQAISVASASEEMAATSADIAHNCHLAADGAKFASDKAKNGAQVVQRTIEGMASIAEQVMDASKSVQSLGSRSDQIGEIVGTIEDIADQTNLLALNAAIEAARAGEQGRGFAVVADEVRALAERTTKATKEIGDMIKTIQQETRGAVAVMEDGVRKVEEGTAGAEESGRALQEILCEIDNLSMQVNQIATAAEEQTATTSDITVNIQKITEVAQNASRTATDSAEATNRLAQVANDLQGLVRHFRS